MIRFSLVVPCYNEAGNIPSILERFAAAPDRAGAELVLVDNGSTDGTREALARLLPSCPFARALRLEENRGYGGGIVAGLKVSRGEFLGWTHGDMQTDPGDAIKGLRLIERARRPERCLVKGRRLGRAWPDAFFTFGMSLFETLYLKAPLSDVNAQPNVFHRSFFEEWRDPPSDFNLDLYAFHMARRLDMEVIRFPVEFARRSRGQSHWNRGLASRLRFIAATIGYSRELKRRSLK